MPSTSVITFFGFYVLNQDEIGVCLTLGKYSGIVRPGPGFILPIFQKILKTKGSLQTVDLPDQQIVLNGNIAVTISGSLNFRVTDPGKALLGVQDYAYSIRQLALTTVSEVLGDKEIEDIRTKKADIASEIEKVIGQKASDWGLAEVDIRLTDAKLDDSLLRAMMRETEAKKEANAIEIKAEADKKVAQIFAHAARTLAASPGSMTLRILQTLSDLSNDKSTVVIPLPVDMLSTLGGGRAVAAAPAAAAKGRSPAPLPRARTRTVNGLRVADCPSCGKKYNVSEILGDERYDARPDVEGQQVRCTGCQTEFTLAA